MARGAVQRAWRVTSPGDARAEDGALALRWGLKRMLRRRLVFGFNHRLSLASFSHAEMDVPSLVPASLCAGARIPSKQLAVRNFLRSVSHTADGQQRWQMVDVGIHLLLRLQHHHEGFLGDLLKVTLTTLRQRTSAQVKLV